MIPLSKLKPKEPQDTQGPLPLNQLAEAAAATLDEPVQEGPLPLSQLTPKGSIKLVPESLYRPDSVVDYDRGVQPNVASVGMRPVDPANFVDMSTGERAIEVGKAIPREGARMLQNLSGAGVELAGQKLADTMNTIMDTDQKYQGAERATRYGGFHAGGPGYQGEPVTNPAAGQREFAQQVYGPVVGAESLQPDPRLGATYEEAIERGTFLTKLAADTAGMAPQMAVTVGAAAIAGPVGAGAVGALMEASAHYDAAIQAGVPPEEAARQAMIIGGGTAILNALPFARLAQKYLPPGEAGVVMGLLIDALSEGTTETLEGGLDPIARMKELPKTREGLIQLLADIAHGVKDEAGVFGPAALTGIGVTAADILGGKLREQNKTQEEVANTVLSPSELAHWPPWARPLAPGEAQMMLENPLAGAEARRQWDMPPPNIAQGLPQVQEPPRPLSQTEAQAQLSQGYAPERPQSRENLFSQQPINVSALPQAPGSEPQWTGQAIGRTEPMNAWVSRADAAVTQGNTQEAERVFEEAGKWLFPEITDSREAGRKAYLLDKGILSTEEFETWLGEQPKALSREQAQGILSQGPTVPEDAVTRDLPQMPEAQAQEQERQEPWQIPKSKLVQHKDTRPRSTASAVKPKSYSEADLHAATVANRANETEAPEVTQHEVGSWGVDSTGEMMQLREYSIDDPKLIFPEGTPKNSTVDKYAEWIKQGHEPPPMTALETPYGIKISEGHHRAAAARQAGRDKIKVWVTASEEYQITGTDGEVITSMRGMTHEDVVRRAIERGETVPPEVLADYPDLKAETRPTRLGQKKAPEQAEAPTESAETLPPSLLDAASVVEFPVDQIQLSEDVPQFKEDADPETGVVAGEELQGEKYERLGTAPIVVWQRNNGRNEVVTGRHRLEFAKRIGETTIPAQVVREADGFTRQDALTLDAEMNIRDGQGRVKDYAWYFRNSEITEEQAEQRGLLSRAKGKAGWALGKLAEDDLFTAYVNGVVSERDAVAIAEAAPGQAGVQRAGIEHALEGLHGDALKHTVQIIELTHRLMGDVKEGYQPDLFKDDEGARRQQREMGRFVARQIENIRARINSVRGAARNPKIAAEEGIDVKKDPQAIFKRIKELQREIVRWNNWRAFPDLRAQVMGEEASARFGQALEVSAQPEPEPEPETPQSVIEAGQDDMFGAPEPEAPAEPVATEPKKPRIGQKKQEKPAANVDLFGNEIAPEPEKPKPVAQEDMFGNEPRVTAPSPRSNAPGQEDIFVGQGSHDPAKLSNHPRLQRLVQLNNAKIAELREEVRQAYEVMNEAASEKEYSKRRPVMVEQQDRITEAQKLIDVLRKQNDDAMREANIQQEQEEPEFKLTPEEKRVIDWMTNAAPGQTQAEYEASKQEDMFGGATTAAPARERAKEVPSKPRLGQKKREAGKQEQETAPAKEVPDFETMVDAAKEWKAAAFLADTLYGENNRGRMKHNNMTTKGDLDAWLMKKFGVDQTEARSVSNALYERDALPAGSVPVEQFRGEPWADAALEQQSAQEQAKEAPSSYGESNTIVTKTEAEAAKQRLRDLLSDRDSDPTSGPLKAEETGVPFDIFKELATLGMYHFEAGARKFTQWAKGMIQDFGPSVKPYLRRVWRHTADVRKAIEQTEKQVRLARRKSESPAQVRKRVRELITAKEGETETITSKNLMKYAMKHQARGARAGHRQGKKDAALSFQQLGEEILADVRKALPDDKEYNEIARRVLRAVKAKSAVEIQNAIDSANRLIQRKVEQTRQSTQRSAFREGQKEITALHTRLAEFAKLNLPAGEYKLVAKVLDKITRVRTNADLKRVMRAINRMVKNYEKAEAIEDFKAAIKESKAEKMRPEIQKMIDALVDQFALSTPSDEMLARIDSLMKAVAKDDIGEIPKALIDAARDILKNQERMPIRMLDPDSIRTVANAIRSLIHQSSLKNQLIATKRLRDARKAAEQGATDITDRHGSKYTVDSTEGDSRGSQGLISRIATWLQLSMETKAEILGGRSSIIYEILFKNLHNGDRAFIELQQKAQDHIREVLNNLGLNGKKLLAWSDAFHTKWGLLGRFFGKEAERVAVEIGGKTVWMTRGERIELLCHISDSSTRAELLRDSGEGIVFDRVDSGDPIKLTADDLRSIRDSASAEEIAIANAMKEFLNGELQARLNEEWVKEFGFELTTQDDYYPRRRSEEHADADPNEVMRNWQNRQLERQSIFKARQSSTAPIIIGDAFNTFFTHINRSSAFIAKGGAVHDAMRLLGNRTFRQAVEGAFKHGNELLRDMEETVRAYRGLDYTPMNAQEKWISGFIRRAHRGVLGMKPHIVLYQTVSFLNAMVEIGPKYMMRSLTHVHPKRTRAEMRKWSPILRARLDGGGHQILTPDAAGLVLSDFYGATQGSVMDNLTMTPIHEADTMVIERIWEAAKLEGEDKGLSGDALMEYAARRAEEVVNRTQPTWDLLTISSLARDARKKPRLKLMVMFSSQRSKNFDMAVRAVSEFRHGDRSPADYAKFAKDLAIPTIVNAVLIHGLRTLFFGGGDDDEGIGEFVMGTLKNLFGNWLVVGDGVAAAVTAFERGYAGANPIYGSDYPDNVLASAADDAIGACWEAGSALGKEARDERDKNGDKKSFKSAMKAADKTLSLIGVASGIPYQGVRMMGRRISRLGQKKKPEQIPWGG